MNGPGRYNMEESGNNNNMIIIMDKNEKRRKVKNKNQQERQNRTWANDNCIQAGTSNMMNKDINTNNQRKKDKKDGALERGEIKRVT